MLQGIKVIDFSRHLPGPHASLRLVDLGAEVIKVEPPEGDPARAREFVFQSQNRGKKSVCLNLKEAKGRRVALDMIRQADVVLESFRPGVSKRLGISYEDAKQVKSDIVYCSLSGFGQNGQMKHLASHDINYMAISGVLAQMKDAKGRPVHPSLTFADLVGGMAAVEAITSALVQRERTGKGAYLDIAVADVMHDFMTYHVPYASAIGHKHGVKYLDGSAIAYHIYETKDHRYISMGAVELKFWKNFCLALGKEEWVEAHLSPSADSNPVFNQVEEMFKGRTLAEWTKFSQQVDCCMVPVLEADEIPASQYANERGLVQEKWGLKFVSTRYIPDGFTIEDSQSAPKLGQHNNDIFEKTQI